MKKVKKRESLAIVGGGITGIAASIELAKSGLFDITIFEKENQLGGLSSSYIWQDVICDRFYHVILSSDSHLLDFIKEIDLESELFWCNTKSAFFGKGKLVSFSSALDFLKFPFLSMWQKFRLGTGIIYTSRIKNPSKISKLYAEQWLSQIFGNPVYRNFWSPLLRSKLGESKDKASAAFIWATINRLYGARSSGTKQEKMGHVKGRYNAILSAAQRKLFALKVNVQVERPVIKADYFKNQHFLEKNKNSDFSLVDNVNNQITLATSDRYYKFDKALFTLPYPEILKILNIQNSHPYWEKMQSIEYSELICIILILKRKLSNYYVINLLDESMPFTGIIEATNVAPPSESVEKHIVYLPKYFPSYDPIKKLSDFQIQKVFIEKLHKVFPDFTAEDILHLKIFREKYVQPLYDLNYFDQLGGYRTPLSNIYVANTSMIFDSTLNNDAAIKIAQGSAKAIIADAN